jgi:hypothetical protein
MKIETKFNINDTVWIMKGNKPYSICIYNIHVIVSAYPTDYYGTGIKQNVTYSDFGNHVSVNESDCYATKEELLASL